MQKHKLLVVAHPDDETIFFGGLVQKSPKDFHIVCVTDGNADGRGDERKKEFEDACKTLGADSFEMWDFPDVYEKRLDIDGLKERLEPFRGLKKIYTHNPIGEYGHPHHQDVSHAVYQVFEKVVSPAYNNFPELLVTLDQKAFDSKVRILTEIYGKETNRFLNIIPASHAEGFSMVSKKEADSIYAFLTGRNKSLEVDAFKNIEGLIREKLKGMKRIF